MPDPTSLTLITLTKDLARSIRRGHPWLYRDAINAPDLDHGAVVEVLTRDRRPIARGYWDATSPIAVRILESGGPGHRFTGVDALVDLRLRLALQRRLRVLDLARTNAFRWVHGEADLLPGIHADYYAGAASIRFDGEGAHAFYSPIADRFQAAAAALPLESIRDRESESGDEVDERIVLESGLRFSVDLAHGQKSGLFLDQRENRERVAARAKGKSVLNLFGYTGGFSVHAAAAGATRTDTVDLARPAVEAAKRNFALNDLPLENAGFHVADVFEFLESSIKRNETWDIVISDPPSFARRQAHVDRALDSYRRLHRLAALVTAPNGLLCAASCSSHVTRDQFLATITEGVRTANRHWRLEEVHPAAFDHPTLEAFPEGDYLKFAIGHVQ